MPFYQRLGDVPRKRHVQFRDNGTLLTEEVMGLEGFSGNESILYHLTSPCRVQKLGDFVPIKRDEWIPDAHAHRHFSTWDVEQGGDPISGRKLLMWNNDVEISLVRPDERMDYFFRNGEGDEVYFVHEGSGTVETTFGDLPYKQGDYVVLPRGTTYRFVPDSLPERHLLFETPGLIEIPKRYRNHYGQLMEHAPYYHRDIHPPTELKTIREKGEFLVRVRVRDGYQDYVVDYHPFDVVGWDGYLYPWTFSIHDFEPITGRIHMPPPSHQTFQGPNFVICSFCPRKLDFDPMAIPIPYHHSNLQSEEMIYYVDGNFSSRKGIEVGSITLHPSGLPARPAAGPRGEVDRDDRDARVGRHVRHVPPAEAHEDGQEAGRREVRLLVVRERRAGGSRRRESRRRHLPPLREVAALNLVLDWDGTVTEVDGLHMIIEEFGDRDVYRRTEGVLGRSLSLHEVIAIEMGTLTLPLRDAVRWVREHVTVRPGFRELARKHRPVILSSGFRELIDPVLEREGVSLDVQANRLDARPDGWRAIWRDEAQCDACGEACKRGGLPNGAPVVYVGDGYSDRCAALAADRVFARDGLARYLDERGVTYEPFEDFVQLAAALGP